MLGDRKLIYTYIWKYIVSKIKDLFWGIAWLWLYVLYLSARLSTNRPVPIIGWDKTSPLIWHFYIYL